MAALSHKPVLIVIAGPNGSVKTIITSKILRHEWLENAVYINAARIVNRVMKEGHDDPITKIISRHEKSILNCKAILPMVDRLCLYDNSTDDMEARPLFRMSDGKLAKQNETALLEWARIIL